MIFMGEMPKRYTEGVILSGKVTAVGVTIDHEWTHLWRDRQGAEGARHYAVISQAKGQSIFFQSIFHVYSGVNLLLILPFYYLKK